MNLPWGLIHETHHRKKIGGGGTLVRKHVQVETHFQQFLQSALSGEGGGRGGCFSKKK